MISRQERQYRWLHPSSITAVAKLASAAAPKNRIDIPGVLCFSLDGTCGEAGIIPAHANYEYYPTIVAVCIHDFYHTKPPQQFIRSSSSLYTALHVSTFTRAGIYKHEFYSTRFLVEIRSSPVDLSDPDSARLVVLTPRAEGARFFLIVVPVSVYLRGLLVVDSIPGYISFFTSYSTYFHHSFHQSQKKKTTSVAKIYEPSTRFVTTANIYLIRSVLCWPAAETRYILLLYCRHATQLSSTQHQGSVIARIVFARHPNPKQQAVAASTQRKHKNIPGLQFEILL